MLTTLKLPTSCLLLGLVLGSAVLADPARSEELPGDRRNAGQGRVLVLPGIWNTRFQLESFVSMAREQHPGFEVHVRPWGIPLLGLYNLSAYERNRETAMAIADELAVWRDEHPSEPLYVVGYSGGGGFANLVVESLPGGVSVDRLILIAPAISPGFPLADRVLPHVSEFVVNYSSREDLQVGWGTSQFGTMDREHTASAGSVGFELEHPRLVQWHWAPSDRRLGHAGHHLSYLKNEWQRVALLPALDPSIDAQTLQEAWLSARTSTLETTDENP